MAKCVYSLCGRCQLIRFIPKVFIFLLVLTTCLYLVSIVFSKQINLETMIGIRKSQFNASDPVREYITGDPGYPLGPEEEHIGVSCIFPRVDPFEPKLMALSGLDKTTLNCNMYLPDLTYLDGNNLIVNETLVNLTVEEVTFSHCKYCSLLRDPGKKRLVRESDWIPFHNTVSLPEDTEYIRVICESTSSQLLSKTYYALVPKKKHLDELESVKFRKRQEEMTPLETLSVVMVGIDSLSRHHLMRSMVKTYSYLTETLKVFDLTMHTQVGVNTFPNFLPLLTGRSEAEVEKWWDRTKYVDAFDFIWRHYENGGYRTFYTQDWPTIEAFHYLKKGFEHAAFQYNTRPLTLAMEYDKDIHRGSKNCAGNRPEVEFHLDYIARALDTFPGKPIFTLSFQTKLCHDNLSNAKIADEYFYNFIKSIHEKGHLNNTLFIFFSDHGPRWGPIRETFNGMIESRTPYTMLAFPNWFLQKYPDIAGNLNTNTNRLTTHYDTHATLLDLLYFKTNMKPIIPQPRHGISLFQKIPKNRTCEDILITPQFCVCGLGNVEILETNLQSTREMAALIIDALNDMRAKNVCAELKLKEIMSVIKIHLSDSVSQEKKEKAIIKVKFVTLPGNAVYEATVIQDTDMNKSVVGRDIERLNMYRGQADCVHDAKIKKFCYCSNLL